MSSIVVLCKFSAVRDSSKYGLDSGCELKRRMPTRNGNPLTANLANDIHSLLLVLKGEGLTYIKDMINIPKKSALSSVSGSPARTSYGTLQNVTKSASCQELSVLRDMITVLQADMLHMKQTEAANQRHKGAEIDSLRDAVTIAQKS